MTQPTFPPYDACCKVYTYSWDFHCMATKQFCVTLMCCVTLLRCNIRNIKTNIPHVYHTKAKKAHSRFEKRNWEYDYYVWNNSSKLIQPFNCFKSTYWNSLVVLWYRCSWIMINTYHLIVQHHFEPSKVVPVKVLILKGQVGIHFLSFITKGMKFFCRIKQNACRGLQRHQISASCGPSSCWDLQWIFLVFMEKRKRITRKGCTKINRRH